MLRHKQRTMIYGIYIYIYSATQKPCRGVAWPYTIESSRRKAACVTANWSCCTKPAQWIDKCQYGFRECRGQTKESIGIYSIRLATGYQRECQMHFSLESFELLWESSHTHTLTLTHTQIDNLNLWAKMLTFKYNCVFSVLTYITVLSYNVTHDYVWRHTPKLTTCFQYIFARRMSVDIILNHSNSF